MEIDKLWNAYLFILYTVLSLLGKFGPPYLGKATAAARAVLPSPTSACWVFLCLCNPRNSDMDYRIFNVRTYYMMIRSVCIHPGIGYTDNESAGQF